MCVCAFVCTCLQRLDSAAPQKKGNKSVSFIYLFFSEEMSYKSWGPADPGVILFSSFLSLSCLCDHHPLCSHLTKSLHLTPQSFHFLNTPSHERLVFPFFPLQAVLHCCFVLNSGFFVLHLLHPLSPRLFAVFPCI